MGYFITKEKEQGLIKSILTKLDISEKDAKIIADVLVSADLRGISSHGLGRLPVYSKRLNLGLIEKDPDIKILDEGKAVSIIDGQNGMGQLATLVATKECIKKSKEFGVSVVGIRNTNHFGIAAYYSMLMSQEGLIGIVMTNTSPLMAPFGGVEAKLGSNPITISIPADKHADIVLDMATSNAARGKLEIAVRNNQDIPDSWAITKDGERTTNPKEGLEGTLLPIGGPKGYGLAVIIDILSGLLTGASYSDNVGALFETDKTQNLGAIIIGLDVSRFMDLSEFTKKIDVYIEDFKNSKKAKGVKEIFMPGEIEFLNEVRNLENDISISDGLYKDVIELGEKVNLDLREYFYTK